MEPLLQVRKVHDDGKHNAFTTLARWRDRLYLAYRTGTRHASPDNPDGAITVLASDDDGLSWTHIAVLESPDGLDMRDPKLVAGPDRLFLHSFEYRDRDHRNAHVAWTEDGAAFSPFARSVQEDDIVIWWPRYHEGRFYASGYRYHGNKKDIRTIFLDSDDGLHWQPGAVVHDVPWANEASLAFEPDGSATILVRNDGQRLTPPASNGNPVLARARPPFTSWESTEIEHRLQGFALHRLDRGYLIAGRAYDADGPHTSVFHYNEGALRRLFTLPSGGDCAYPGIVRDGNRVIMSYYSSHEYLVQPQGTGPACIYVAHFDLRAVLGRLGPI